MARGCWQALNHASIYQYASYRARSTRTSKNNIQWWEILPSSDKEITPLKSSLSLGYNLRKRIMLILLTAVDLICRSTPNYHALHAAWLDNLCLESTSLPSKAFQNFLLISITNLSFFVQMQVVRRSLSLSIKIIYNQVLRDRKERACTVLTSEFPAPSR